MERITVNEMGAVLHPQGNLCWYVDAVALEYRALKAIIRVSLGFGGNGNLCMVKPNMLRELCFDIDNSTQNKVNALGKIQKHIDESKTLSVNDFVTWLFEEGVRV
tara:strand:- start:1868 stop:2182 length:315 start_codon:yes stop_codon:yes gene_type:complete